MEFFAMKQLKEILINLSLKVKKIGDTQLIFWRKDE